jgi:hypothetical protein
MLFSWVGLGLIVFYDKKKNDFFVLTKEDEFNSHFIREQLLFEENKATVQKVGLRR